MKYKVLMVYADSFSDGILPIGLATLIGILKKEYAKHHMPVVVALRTRKDRPLEASPGGVDDDLPPDAGMILLQDLQGPAFVSLEDVVAHVRRPSGSAPSARELAEITL